MTIKEQFSRAVVTGNAAFCQKMEGLAESIIPLEHGAPLLADLHEGDVVVFDARQEKPNRDTISALVTRGIPYAIIASGGNSLFGITREQPPEAQFLGFSADVLKTRSPGAKLLEGFHQQAARIAAHAAQQLGPEALTEIQERRERVKEIVDAIVEESGQYKGWARKPNARQRGSGANNPDLDVPYKDDSGSSHTGKGGKQKPTHSRDESNGRRPGNGGYRR